MWPVAGMFCRGGVCGAAVVVATASTRPGLDEEGLLLAARWCAGSTLPLWACDWPDGWFWPLCDWFLDTVWAAL